MKEESNNMTIHEEPKGGISGYWEESDTPATETVKLKQAHIQGATDTDKEILKGCKDEMLSLYRAMITLENKANTGADIFHYICQIETDRSKDPQPVLLSFKKRP